MWVEFGTGLGGDGVADGVEQRSVPCGGETDGLRKDGGVAVACVAMETFIPPVVGWQAKAWDCRGAVAQLSDAFCNRHLLNEGVDACVDLLPGLGVGADGLCTEGN